MSSLEQFCKSKNINLTPKQFAFAEYVIELIKNEEQAEFFITGPIGTGKTFVFKVIEDFFRKD